MFLKTIYRENKKLLLLFLHFCFSLFFKFGQSQGRCSSFVPGLVISNVEILLQLYGHSHTEV